MLKYSDTLITFSEVPDEISLCINISGCKVHCEGCHSKHLWEDIGTDLTKEELHRLIEANEGITCVCLMGGDHNPMYITELAKEVKERANLKVAWYSGTINLYPVILNGNAIKNFDFIKLGPYIEELGPLTSRTTNQRFYKIDSNENGAVMKDITELFWK